MKILCTSMAAGFTLAAILLHSKPSAAVQGAAPELPNPSTTLTQSLRAAGVIAVPMARPSRTPTPAILAPSPSPALTPTPTALPAAGGAPNATDSSASSGGSSSNSAAVIGGAVGGTLAGALVCALAIGLCWVRRGKPRRAPEGTRSAQPAEPSQPPPIWATAVWASRKALVADQAGLGTAQQLHNGNSAEEVRQPSGPTAPPPYSSPTGPWQAPQSSHRPSSQGMGPVTATAIGVGPAAPVGWAGLQVVQTVGVNISWTSSFVGLLEEVVKLLKTVRDENEDCSRITQWAQGMMKALGSIGGELRDQDAPAAARPLMAQAKMSLEDLLKVAADYHKANAFKQFLASEFCRKGFTTVDSNLRRALAALNLSLVQEALATMQPLQLQADDRRSLVIENLTRQHTLLGAVEIRLGQFAGQVASTGLGDASGGGINAADTVAEALEQLQIPREDVQLMAAPIGQGMFAKVYPCHYQGEIRAAKVVSLADCTSKTQLYEVYGRFTRELYIMSTLRSTEVVQVFGAITEAQQLTIIMELGERGSLRGVLDDPAVSGALTGPARHVVLSDVAAGMAYLYGKGVQHRDLKSLNVLVMHDWHAKISDCGLSGTRQSLSTIAARSDSRGGAWAWKAPELLDGAADFTEQSDVYSFGVIVWEVVCGGVMRPWHDLDTVQLFAAVRQGNRLLIDPKCSTEYRTIMQGAWKGPADRPTFSSICTELRRSQGAVDQHHSS